MTIDESKFFKWVVEKNRWDLVVDNDITIDDFASSYEYHTVYKRDKEAEYKFDREIYKYLDDYNNKFGKMPTYDDFLKIVDGSSYYENISLSQYTKDEIISEMLISKRNVALASCIKYATADYQNAPILTNDLIDNIVRNIEKSTALINKFSEFNYSYDFGSLKDLYIEREDPLQSAKHFYPTGIDDLDQVFKGWDKDSDYVSIAGRPGTGKSMILSMFAAKQLIIGKRVAIYSGEMAEKQVVERIISCLTRLSLTNIYHGNLSQEHKQAYFDFINKTLPKLKLYILTPEHLGGKYANCRNLEKFCQKVNADILFIDQQSLMEDIDHARVQYERAANISRQIKAMRDRLNIPIITAVQLNRTKTENGESDTVQIAGSDVIAQDSTKVLILSKANVDGADFITLTVVKNRSGASYGKFVYEPDFEYCNFKKDNNAVFRFNSYVLNNNKIEEEGIVF